MHLSHSTLKALVSVIFQCHGRITNALVFRHFRADRQIVDIADPILKPRRHITESAIHLRFSQKQGISRSVLKIIQEASPKMAESRVKVNHPVVLFLSGRTGSSELYRQHLDERSKDIVIGLHQTHVFQVFGAYGKSDGLWKILFGSGLSGLG